MTGEHIHEIDPRLVRPFIHRERNRDDHKRATKDMREHGQIRPGKVRDITHLPADQRKRPGGGTYEYELIYGEGRLEAALSNGQPFLAKKAVGRKSDLDSAGEFLRENINRSPLSPAEMAALIGPMLKEGKTAGEISALLNCTEGHVQKLIRVRNKAASEEIATLPMNVAELLTALPKPHQTLVMREWRENPKLDLRELTRHARRESTKRNGKLTAGDLKKSVQRVDEDLRAMRDRSALVRDQHSLSAFNLELLLADPKYRSAMIRRGINVEKFEALLKLTRSKS